MKRMNPDARKMYANDAVRTLEGRLLCQYGRWNTNKIMDEVERILKNKRRTR